MRTVITDPPDPLNWKPSVMAGWFTSEEIMQHFGWKKQQLSLTAKRENWRRLVISPRVFYHVDDVRVYAVLRLRTTLAAQLGRPAVRGLLRIFRTGEVDTICPTCGGYAFAYGPDGVCGKEHRFRTKQETA